MSDETTTPEPETPGLIPGPAPKPILESKTVWFNALVMLGGYYLQRRGVSLSAEEAGAVLGVGNLVFRYITGSGLNLRSLVS